MRDGAALVDVEAVGVNHAGTLIGQGSDVVRVPFPYPAGGEGSGTILEVDLPVTAHDFFHDLIVTPEGTLRPRYRHRQPKGIRADHLTDENRRAILPLGGIGIR
jgi:NADPH:quinone reductase-like Zn-dependent oxidoreductase